MTPSVRLPLLVGCGLLAGAALLSGCGPPPEPDTPGTPVPPAGSNGTPTPRFPTPPSPGSSLTPSPGFGEDFAVPCGDEPGEDEIVAVLHADGMLDPSVDAEVVEGPLCAGSWQYAVVQAPDRDPVQVVTRTAAGGGLELVTAGGDVCSAEVRIQAPVGIRVAASCVR